MLDVNLGDLEVSQGQVEIAKAGGERDGGSDSEDLSLSEALLTELEHEDGGSDGSSTVLLEEEGVEEREVDSGSAGRGEEMVMVSYVLLFLSGRKQVTHPFLSAAPAPASRPEDYRQVGPRGRGQDRTRCLCRDWAGAIVSRQESSPGPAAICQ